MWEFIHFGDFGQLKVLNLSKTDNMRIKFQNLILISCWKFRASFAHVLKLKPSLFIKLKHHLGVPEISPVFCVCVQSFHLILVSSWSKQIFQSDAAPESRSSPAPLLATLEVSFTLPSILAFEEAFLPVDSTNWWHSLWDEVQSVSQELCCHASQHI